MKSERGDGEGGRRERGEGSKTSGSKETQETFQRATNELVQDTRQQEKDPTAPDPEKGCQVSSPEREGRRKRGEKRRKYEIEEGYEEEKMWKIM